MHRATYHYFGGLIHQVTCTCGERSPHGTKQQVEDWALHHAVEVQQLRARLRGRSPSLFSQHAWFTRQANNPDNNDTDRMLWQILADELVSRIPDPDPDDQPSLW